MAKKPEILNLRVRLAGGVAVVWETPDGFRWHVPLELQREGRQQGGPWLPLVPYRVADQTRVLGKLGYNDRFQFQLRKNPPEKGHPNYRYDARGRWLDATAKANAPVVQHVLAEAERLGLYQIAVDKAAADEQARVDAIRDEQAADMLAAAQRIADEGLPGAAEFLASLQQLTPDQQARMLQLIKWGGR